MAFNHKSISIAAFNITHSVMKLIVMTFNVTTFNTMVLGETPLVKMPLNRMTLGITLMRCTTI